MTRLIVRVLDIAFASTSLHFVIEIEVVDLKNLAVGFHELHYEAQVLVIYNLYVEILQRAG